mmetsp:Transcript_40337/g.87937  ORF Transcript_40337/g.87937 Transcript_40337/m.87937 type:complete len:195 (+) Transcript_40337:34-618(+)
MAYLFSLDDAVNDLLGLQRETYLRLCVELRLKPNSAVLRRFDPELEPEAPHTYDFADNYLGDAQIRAVGAALALDRRMEELILGGNGLRDNGMVALVQQLKYNPPDLKYLDLSSSRFSIVGATALRELVNICPCLTLVGLDDTCLDPAFIAKRGFSCDYNKIAGDISEVLNKRDEMLQEEEQKQHMQRSELTVF